MLGGEVALGEKISGRRWRSVVKREALRAALGESVSEVGLRLALELMPLLARGEVVEGE